MELDFPARHDMIIRNGGWLLRRKIGRPKMRFCAFLCVLWFPLVVPASILLRAVYVEGPTGSSLGLLCEGVLILEAALLVLTALFWVLERPRKFTVVEAGPLSNSRGRLHGTKKG